MAKETKKAADQQQTTPLVELTEENVQEQVRNGNLLKDKNVQAALEKIQKEEDEHQVNEAQNMIMCAKYINTKELYHTRARRREAKITKETLTKCTEVLSEVLAGKVTPSEYREKKREILKKKDEDFRKSDDELRKDMQELRNSFTGRYQFQAEWDRY